MKQLSNITLLILALFFSGCVGSVHIERSETMLNSEGQQVKIVCIDPRIYFKLEKENFNLQANQSSLNRFKKDIILSSRKNGLDLILLDLDENTKPHYYTDLLALKGSLLAVNFNQKTPLNFDRSYYENNKVIKKVFVYPPKIPFEFSEISNEYGTPLFSYIGIYVDKNEITLYHLLVDTDFAETVYREIRTVNKAFSSDLVGQLLYDSYAGLKNELYKKRKSETFTN